jgi:hypothetical protein
VRLAVPISCELPTLRAIRAWRFCGGYVRNEELVPRTNAKKVLRNLAEKLGAVHSMTVAALVHEPQRAPVMIKQTATLPGIFDAADAQADTGDDEICQRCDELLGKVWLVKDRRSPN